MAITSQYSALGIMHVTPMLTSLTNELTYRMRTENITCKPVYTTESVISSRYNLRPGNSRILHLARFPDIKHKRSKRRKLRHMEKQLSRRVMMGRGRPRRFSSTKLIPYAVLICDWNIETERRAWWAAWVVKFLAQPTRIQQQQIDATVWAIKKKYSWNDKTLKAVWHAWA